MQIPIETFKKEAGASFDVNLKLGIEDNAPGYSNVMFYVQMDSYTKDEGVKVTRPIYLTLPEMVKLSALMTTASQFWTSTFDKNSPEDKERIRKFIAEWKKISKSIDQIFEK
jgi:hypothetical protein